MPLIDGLLDEEHKKMRVSELRCLLAPIPRSVSLLLSFVSAMSFSHLLLGSRGMILRLLVLLKGDSDVGDQDHVGSNNGGDGGVSRVA